MSHEYISYDPKGRKNHSNKRYSQVFSRVLGRRALPKVTFWSSAEHHSFHLSPNAAHHAGLSEDPPVATRSVVTSAAKRTLDIVGAGTGIVLLSPLLIGIAVAIKLNSKGPVLFSQRRHGLDGETFTALKFRSMYTDRCDTSGVQQTVKDDPRITPVGRFLRRSNFDELPQLFNVLSGDMSLVGPRPHVPGMLANGVPYEVFDPRYQLRHQVRPGITGLAQVNGFRGETKTAHAAKMRLEYDLDYIRRQSLYLDMKILVGTVAREFFSGNGY